MDTKGLLAISPEVPANRLHFESLLEKFLGSFDCTELTRECYSRRLRHFTSWLDRERHYFPDREVIVAYKRFLKESKFQANSISGYLTAVKSFFSWLEGAKIYPNVARGTRSYKRPRGFRKDALTVGQVRALLGSMVRTSLLDLRDHALITLLVGTGLRTIEIVRANVEDIRSVSSDSMGLWVQGKGATDKDSFVVLTESVLSPLQEFLTARGPLKEGDPLFASLSDGNFGCRLSTRTIRRVVKQRLRSVNLESPRLSAHSLRHTAVTLALQGGASLQEAQSMARHSNIATTITYAHTIDKAKGVAEKSIENMLRMATDDNNNS